MGKKLRLTLNRNVDSVSATRGEENTRYRNSSEPPISAYVSRDIFDEFPLQFVKAIHDEHGRLIKVVQRLSAEVQSERRPERGAVMLRQVQQDVSVRATNGNLVVEVPGQVICSKSLDQLFGALELTRENNGGTN